MTTTRQVFFMRVSSLLLRLGIFAIAALVCLLGARMAVAVVEAQSATAVEERLLQEGYDWAEVQSDGLQVVIEGEAPTEVVRFRAMSAAGTVVDASRVIDNITVAESALDTTPEFSIEILRNESGVSLIGLMPSSSDREDVVARVSSIAAGAPVTDLLDQADYPVADSWPAALKYALRALGTLPRSKISVTATKVEVTAIADSARQRAEWEDDLVRTKPNGVKLALNITAPRPVVTPFTIRFTQQDDKLSFDACTVDTEEALALIDEVARKAGLAGDPNCVLALGVPTITWGDAVATTIEAVDTLGGGTVTISDADITLTALEGADQKLFDRVVGELENELPDVFALKAELPVKPDASQVGPPQFTATLSPEGLVQLRGKVTDELMNNTTRTYAQARFGQGQVNMGTRIEPAKLPADWAIRVLAGIEGLSEMASGVLVVEPDMISVRGKTGNKQARADISRMLIEKLGSDAEFTIDATYDEALDPIAALPTPQECVDKIGVVTKRVKINFEPGSAKIVAEARTAMDEIANILRKCIDLELEIAGYTDSQGRDEMNLQLSQNRAEAVVDALRSRRVPTGSFKAIGYGEESPIASNDTADGREANRRIEFRLMNPPAPVQSAEEVVQSGEVADGSENPRAEASPRDTNQGKGPIHILSEEEASDMPRPPVREQ